MSLPLTLLPADRPFWPQVYVLACSCGKQYSTIETQGTCPGCAKAYTIEPKEA